LRKIEQIICDDTVLRCIVTLEQVNWTALGLTRSTMLSVGTWGLSFDFANQLAGCKTP